VPIFKDLGREENQFLHQTIGRGLCRPAPPPKSPCKRSPAEHRARADQRIDGLVSWSAVRHDDSVVLGAAKTFARVFSGGGRSARRYIAAIGEEPTKPTGADIGIVEDGVEPLPCRR